MTSLHFLLTAIVVVIATAAVKMRVMSRITTAVTFAVFVPFAKLATSVCRCEFGTDEVMQWLTPRFAEIFGLLTSPPAFERA